MDNSLKILFLQHRVKALEGLLFIREKDNFLNYLMEKLAKGSENEKIFAKTSLIDRGHFIEDFLNDENSLVRDMARSVFKLRIDENGHYMEDLNKPLCDFELNDSASSVERIAENMFSFPGV